MKKIFLLSILFFFSQESIAQIKNKIVIKIENEIITNFEIKNKILTSLILSNEEINQENINRYKKSVIKQLIDNKLKKIEVNKYDIKKDDAKINAYLKSLNIPNVKKKFLNNGLDFDLYINELSIEIKWRELIYKIYSKKINIDEDILKKDMDIFIKKKSEIKEYKISEIEIMLNENEDAGQIILNAQKQIKEEGFETTALKYNNSYSASQEGSLGWINSKSLSKEIYEMLIKMNINEVSSPIKRQNSIIFLKLNDKRISKTNNIDIVKIKNDLIVQKENEQYQLYSNSRLSKLRNTSTIEYK